MRGKPRRRADMRRDDKYAIGNAQSDDLVQREELPSQDGTMLHVPPVW
jgi:hypothetical protein